MPPLKGLGLFWENDPDLPTTYATQIYIQRTASEYYLVFGEPQIPFLGAESESPSSLPIRPVAKIVIPASAMGPFIRVMENSHADPEFNDSHADPESNDDAPDGDAGRA